MQLQDPKTLNFSEASDPESQSCCSAVTFRHRSPCLLHGGLKTLSPGSVVFQEGQPLSWNPGHFSIKSNVLLCLYPAPSSFAPSGKQHHTYVYRIHSETRVFCLHTVSWSVLWEQFRKPQLAQGSFLCICDNSGLVLQRSNLKKAPRESKNLGISTASRTLIFFHGSHLKISYVYNLNLLANQMHSARKKK